MQMQEDVLGASPQAATGSLPSGWSPSVSIGQRPTNGVLARSWGTTHREQSPAGWLPLWGSTRRHAACATAVDQCGLRPAACRPQGALGARRLLIPRLSAYRTLDPMPFQNCSRPAGGRKGFRGIKPFVSSLRDPLTFYSTTLAPARRPAPFSPRHGTNETAGRERQAAE